MIAASQILLLCSYVGASAASGWHVTRRSEEWATSIVKPSVPSRPVLKGHRNLLYKLLGDKRDLQNTCMVDSAHDDDSPVEYYEYEFWYAMGMDGFVDEAEMEVVKADLFSSAKSKIMWCYSQNSTDDDDIANNNNDQRMLTTQENRALEEARRQARQLRIISVGLGALDDDTGYRCPINLRSLINNTNTTACRVNKAIIHIVAHEADNVDKVAEALRSGLKSAMSLGKVLTSFTPDINFLAYLGDSQDEAFPPVDPGEDQFVSLPTTAEGGYNSSDTNTVKKLDLSSVCSEYMSGSDAEYSKFDFNGLSPKVAEIYLPPYYTRNISTNLAGLLSNIEMPNEEGVTVYKYTKEGFEPVGNSTDDDDSQHYIKLLIPAIDQDVTNQAEKSLNGADNGNQSESSDEVQQYVQVFIPTRGRDIATNLYNGSKSTEVDEYTKEGIMVLDMTGDGNGDGEVIKYIQLFLPTVGRDISPNLYNGTKSTDPAVVEYSKLELNVNNGGNKTNTTGSNVNKNQWADKNKWNSTKNATDSQSTNTDKGIDGFNVKSYQSAEPSAGPTAGPSSIPTAVPTAKPTNKPTAEPTSSPSIFPSDVPTTAPTAKPTSSPSKFPTDAPTNLPTVLPTILPTLSPSSVPTAVPVAAIKPWKAKWNNLKDKWQDNKGDNETDYAADSTTVSSASSPIDANENSTNSTDKSLDLGSSDSDSNNSSSDDSNSAVDDLFDAIPIFTASDAPSDVPSDTPSDLSSDVPSEMPSSVPTFDPDAALARDAEDDDNDPVLAIAWLLPLILVLLLVALLVQKKRKTQTARAISPKDNANMARAMCFNASDFQLVGIADPPGSFHEGSYHYLRDGTKFLSTCCESCHETRRNVHLAAASNMDADLYAKSSSPHSASRNEDELELLAADSKNLSRRHTGIDVHRCSSAMCEHCIALAGKQITFLPSMRSEIPTQIQREDDITKKFATGSKDYYVDVYGKGNQSGSGSKV